MFNFLILTGNLRPESNLEKSKLLSPYLPISIDQAQFLSHQRTYFFTSGVTFI
jgi:hypothetical protein